MSHTDTAHSDVGEVREHHTTINFDGTWHTIRGHHDDDGTDAFIKSNYVVTF